MPATHKTPKPPCADCGFYRGEHGRKAGVEGACRRYQAPGPKRGTRRSVRAQGIAAQLTFARAAGFQNREGHGSDMVFYGRDAAIALVSEHKHRRSFTAADIEAAMQQAESYCRTERGAPLPCVGWTTKPGPGGKAHRYLIYRAEQWPDVTERLFGE